MHDSLSLSNFIITAGQGNQFTLSARGLQNFVDPLRVMSNQRISSLKDGSRGSIVILELHHRAGHIISSTITKVILKSHQNGEVSSPEAVNTLIGIANNKYGALLPVVKCLRISAVGHQ